MSAPVIALIVTGEKTFQEFTIFVKTLEVWHPDAQLFVFTDGATQPHFTAFKCKPKLHIQTCLDKYTGLNRTDMEARPSSKYNTLWTEFMYEKAEALRWAFKTVAPENGVWFMDADIVHLAPLPAIQTGALVALSPHYIRDGDARLYGKYNGGYLWFSNPSYTDVWIAGAAKSRFYEQAALEDVAIAATTGLYEFPPQVNFGWWRMFQGSDHANVIQAKFGFNRSDRSVGIRFSNEPLQSIHTHLYDKSNSSNGVFNTWLDTTTTKFASHPPLRAFRKTVGF